MTASAKFLVLLGSASRALLFDCNQRLLGEVIEDDGFIVDSLLLHATACELPRANMLEVEGSSAASTPARCYELSDAQAAHRHGAVH